MNQAGRDAEDRALALLEAAGLKLVARNWHCRGGEIDLIMRDGAYWVFIEVRHRGGSRFGSAADSITASKQRKLLLAAEVYLAGKGIDAPCRFDAVVSVGDARPQWLKNVFTQ
ncbi:YraN family protein [Chromobacterium sp. IIBBL 290-4]|uniref:YraN family protein n=1 Tax=Chromobacterium sp. IIBBL 290-4 TaxID=2953890 RepID=UPI0020B66039|nr:YraN family protein [Chromobacterium sp. IIBBL 290-4]UTH76361.1 YraN family protein [Chromobacterium sp. IIBBL 290-4]